MALTISEDFRMSAGGRQMRFVNVTHDGSTSDITAKSIGLTYIDWFSHSWATTSTDITVSTVHGHQYVSIVAGDSPRIAWCGDPLPKAASTSQLVIIGW